MPIGQIKRWSYSAVKDFEACPYRIYLKRIERSPQPEATPDAPNVRGAQIHEEAELFIKGEGELTRNLRKFEEEFNQLAEWYKEGKVQVEQEWGFDRDWGQREWNDKDCWALVKLDAMVLGDTFARAIDFKTGKSFGNEVPHTMQLQLYALATFLRYPNILTVQAELWYLDEGKATKKNYIRTMVPALLPRWEKRALALTECLTFPAKPNKSKCRWCPFGTENGTGRCAHAAGLNG